MWSSSLLSLAALFALQHSILAEEDAGELICNRDIYGDASLDAANSVIERMPFSTPRNILERRQFEGLRTFAEPRFTNPQYSYVQRGQYAIVQDLVTNPDGATYPIAQVPKMWKMKGLNMALLMNGDANSAIPFPILQSSWKAVNEAARTLASYCAGEEHMGGMYVMLTPKKNAITPDGHLVPLQRFALMVLYMYQPGAPFEEALNSYTLHGWPIRPYHPLEQLGTSLGFNGTNATQASWQTGSGLNATKQNWSPGGVNAGVNVTEPALLPPNASSATLAGGGGSGEGTIEPFK